MRRRRQSCPSLLKVGEALKRLPARFDLEKALQREKAAKPFEKSAVLSAHSAGQRATVKVGRKPLWRSKKRRCAAPHRRLSEG